MKINKPISGLKKLNAVIRKNSLPKPRKITDDMLFYIVAPPDGFDWSNNVGEEPKYVAKFECVVPIEYTNNNVAK